MVTTLLQVISLTTEESCGKGSEKPHFSRAASCSLTHGTIFLCLQLCPLQATFSDCIPWVEQKAKTSNTWSIIHS